MKRINRMVFLCLLFTISMVSSQQKEPAVLWSKMVGGSLDDFPFDGVTYSEDYFIACGGTKSFAQGRLDVWLVAYSRTGDTLWTRSYGGAKEDVGNSVESTHDNGFLVCASSNSFTEYSSLWLIKTNSVGDTLWSKLYSTNEDVTAGQARRVSDNSFIVACRKFTKTDSLTHSDIWLLKIDEFGDTLWTQTLGTDSLLESASSISETMDKGFIISGNVTKPGTQQTKGFILKTDSLGAVQWVTSLDGNSWAYEVHELPDSSFAVCGSIVRDSTRLMDGFLSKLSHDGKQVWTKFYGTKFNDRLRSLNHTHDNGFILLGDYETSAAYDDIFVVKVNSDGEELWQKSYGSKYRDWGHRIHQVPSGDYIVFGKRWRCQMKRWWYQTRG